MTETFKELLNKHMETLELYVPIVARVHGGSHPEFYEVHRLFNSMQEALKDERELQSVFSELKNVTNNYEIPADTCESFEAVYKMLAELDKAYIQ